MRNGSPQIISINGVPRSGTSWLGQIFNSSPQVAFRFQPLFSYAFKGRLKPDSSIQDINSFFSDIENTRDEFVLQIKNISGNKEVDFIKNIFPSHLVIKEVRYHYILENLLKKLPQIKLIGIVRNPCASINSWIKAPKEFNPSWNELEEWRFAALKNLNKPEEFNGFEKWKEVANMFLEFSKKYPDNFRLVQYEKLNVDTEKYIRELFGFCGIEYSKQTIEFITKSKNTASSDAYSVFRKAQINDSWKKELNPVIAEAIISELKGTRLEQFLL